MGLYKLPRRTSGQRHAPIHQPVAGRGADSVDDQSGDQHACRVCGVSAPCGAAADHGRSRGARHQRAAESELAAVSSTCRSTCATATTIAITRRQPFDATEYVRFDAVPEEIEHGISEQFDINRQTFDAMATFSLPLGRRFAPATGTMRGSVMAADSATSATTSSVFPTTPSPTSTSPCARPTRRSQAPRRRLHRIRHRLRRPRRHPGRAALLRRSRSQPPSRLADRGHPADGYGRRQPHLCGRP